MFEIEYSPEKNEYLILGKSSEGRRRIETHYPESRGRIYVAPEEVAGAMSVLVEQPQAASSLYEKTTMFQIEYSAATGIYFIRAMTEEGRHRINEHVPVSRGGWAVRPEQVGSVMSLLTEQPPRAEK